MGSARSSRIETAPRKEIVCPCETNEANRQAKIEEIVDVVYNTEDESSSDEESTADDEWFEERLLISEETRQLRQLAEFFLCPEKPVDVDPATMARCYFDRASALAPDDSDEALERNLILEDMKAMKKLAVDYLCPELPVNATDPFVCGRNYFNRPSAKVPPDEENEDERNLILEDMKTMKKLAVDYLCPELPVNVTDPLVCGRNYFTRPSAEPYELSTDEHNLEEEERHLILEELRWMKTLADAFMHPEVPVDYSGLELEGHFDMDEDISRSSYTYHYHGGASGVDNAKPSALSAKSREDDLAFSPDCVMMMH